MLEEAYDLMKKFGTKMASKREINYISKEVFYDFAYHTNPLKLLDLTKNIILKEKLVTIKSNWFLSGVILMIYNTLNSYFNEI